MLCTTGEKFPRYRRLKGRKNFALALRSRFKASSEFLLAFYLPTSPQLLGIVISRKVGNAVIRNGIKRQIREIYRRNLRRFPEHGALVFLVRKVAEFEQIKSSMFYLSEKVNALYQQSLVTQREEDAIETDHLSD